MKSDSLRYYLLFLFLAMTVTLSGCFHAGLKKNPTNPEALRLLASLQAVNSELTTFKGIGSVKLKSKAQNDSFRLAWAGQTPDKLRLVVLFSGKPIETFATDGKYIYLKSHAGQHKFIKHKSSNASLKRLIAIPVTTKEIILLLTGRLPLPEYNNATLTKSDDDDSYIIELYRPWRGVVGKVFLDKDKKLIGYERIKGKQKIYSIQLDDFRTLNGFTLPYAIHINANDAACKILCSRYYTNPEVKPDVFILNK